MERRDRLVLAVVFAEADQKLAADREGKGGEDDHPAGPQPDHSMEPKMAPKATSTG